MSAQFDNRLHELEAELKRLAERLAQVERELERCQRKPGRPKRGE